MSCSMHRRWPLRKRTQFAVLIVFAAVGWAEKHLDSLCGGPARQPVHNRVAPRASQVAIGRVHHTLCHAKQPCCPMRPSRKKTPSCLPRHQPLQSSGDLLDVLSWMLRDPLRSLFCKCTFLARRVSAPPKKSRSFYSQLESLNDHKFGPQHTPPRLTGIGFFLCVSLCLGGLTNFGESWDPFTYVFLGKTDKKAKTDQYFLCRRNCC